MATFTMPPIDLYPETNEDDRDRERFEQEHYLRPSDDEQGQYEAMTTPRGNGDLDPFALDAGSLRLYQVLGW